MSAETSEELFPVLVADLLDQESCELLRAYAQRGEVDADEDVPAENGQAIIRQQIEISNEGLRRQLGGLLRAPPLG